MINTFSAFFMRRRNWTIPYVLFLAIFVVIPLLLIVYYAFTNDEGMFTFANFRKFMIHPEAINTFVYSVGIALITTILCLLLGYPAEDVRGFMGIGYKKCLYTGYWKVYEKAEEKIALFSEYDRAMDLALSMAYERQNILKLKEVFEVDSREKKPAV